MGRKVNYLYFGIFFLLLVLLISSSIFTKVSLGGSEIFFFLYALGQAMVEIALCILIAFVLRAYAGPLISACFIGATFVMMIVHIFDFFMDRILDFSVWEALNVFVLQESFGNFLFLLDASGISLWVWFAFFALLAALPFIGVFVYHLTDKWAAKRAFPLTHAHFLQIVLCAPLALLLWDFSASKVIQPNAYTAFRKSLPWKATFLEPKTTLLNLPAPLKEPVSEALIADAIGNDKTTLTKKPNIFLIITESLREDCMRLDVAPNLTQFKNDFVQFERAISSGNGTHLSWFSIFHSELPFLWKSCQLERKLGSPALQALKKWGYKIHLYTSAQLSYYNMEELLFGKNSYLLDTKETFHHTPPHSAADSDAAALEKMQKDIRENPHLKEGNLFILFWDCTHFDYSWGRSWNPKFKPFAQEFAYFRAIQSAKTIQAIKNKYQNAVNYMDSLFGKLMAHMENDAVVIFTGDHGEEFFEHGHLFHNSHLSKEQTSVPLYFKFGDGSKKVNTRALISHLDLFPSLLDYLGAPKMAFLKGRSIFEESKSPFAITARFNAGCTPYEFSIHNGENKLIAQFSNTKEIYKAEALKIISLKTHEDQIVLPLEPSVWIESEFGEAIKSLSH
jgi:glucan phosphoethanolaminetransferase (alkaline phosphatase superfamily)